MNKGHKTLGYMKGYNKKNVIGPEKAPIVQRAFVEYALGKTLTKITNGLN